MEFDALQHTVHLAEKYLRKFNHDSEYDDTKVYADTLMFTANSTLLLEFQMPISCRESLSEI